MFLETHECYGGLALALNGRGHSCLAFSLSNVDSGVAASSLQ
jgi:hypothetical protein